MRSSPRTTPTRARLGGTAAVSAGLCYGAAGFFDRPDTDALVSVLSVALPALFLERVMNSIRNGIGMRETEIARKLS
jgi:hypothetical protein